VGRQEKEQKGNATFFHCCRHGDSDEIDEIPKGPDRRDWEDTVLNFQNLMKQAQKLQEKMAKVQEELAAKTVEATSGGGMVTAVVNGKFELMAIRIEKDVVNPDDIDMLQDLIIAAVNEGVRKAQEMASAEMAKVTGGMKLPGMM
jgi:hypothetical protein